MANAPFGVKLVLYNKPIHYIYYMYSRLTGLREAGVYGGSFIPLFRSFWNFSKL